MTGKGKYKHIIVVRRLSEEVLRYRNENNLSREDLAFITGIAPRTLANIECCDTKCSIVTLKKSLSVLKLI